MSDVIKLLEKVFKDDSNRIIHDAIYRLYTNARTIDVDTNNNWVVKDDDGKEVSINWTNVETKVKEIEAEVEKAEKVKETKKASAITKLKALGLDDDEINALTGQ
jgi:replicative DNA helicase